MENKISDKDKMKNGKKGHSNNPSFELNIFKRMKTIYDVKFLKLNELEDNSLERSLINNTDLQNA